ncbi:MAG: hypothetical protein ACOX58_07035 [Christensenellales bacterium]|jgi:hypothetical protein
MKPAKILLLAFVLCCLTFTSIAAESVSSEQMQSIVELRASAPATWTAVYEAHGRKISVDVPITIPAVHTFPIVQATGMPASSLLDVNPEGINSPWGQVLDGVGVINSPLYFRWDKPDMKTSNDLAAAHPTPKGLVGSLKILTANHIDMDASYAYKNSGTMRQAEAFLKEVWATYFPGVPLDMLPYRIYAGQEMRKRVEGNGAAKGKIWEDYEGYLYCEFHQVINGIPFMDVIERAYTTYAGGMNLPVSDDYFSMPFIKQPPRCMAMLNGGKHYGVDGLRTAIFSTVTVQKTIADDVPLCSFDKVLSTFESLIEQGKLRSVDALRLGYVGWYDKNDSETLTLLPFWVLEGELFESPTKNAPLYGDGYDDADAIYPHSTEYGMVMVNAQTGELIDSWRTDKERVFDRPDIVTWK